MKKLITIFFLAISLLYSFNAMAYSRLKDKVVIITGAGKGIGVDIAKFFAAEGAKLVLLSRTEADLKNLTAEINKSGGTASYIVADVSKYNDLQNAAAFAVKQYGKIDVLVHNAARYDEMGRIDVMTEESWRNIIHTNLDGTFYAVKSVLPAMQKQKYGRIVLISSISGPRVGLPGFSNYTASKAGVNGFMKTIAIELAKYNITVNAVEPGNIMTSALENANGAEEVANRVKAIPMGRLGTGTEVAQASLFLASDEAGYITGQSIIVDGGQTLPETHHGEF
jgi:3-oxoacyl-[acyl-carrier protein] reductase